MENAVLSSAVGRKAAMTQFAHSFFTPAPWNLECCPPEFILCDRGNLVAVLTMDMYATRSMEALMNTLWPGLLEDC
jgi:hypothetical protein